MNNEIEIRARVSSRMLGYTDRLFSAKHETILTELIQNARRAGATEVRIDVESVPGTGGRAASRVVVSDNGRGVSDPELLLDLSETGFSEAEDPAGMGFFVLAGCRDVKVASGDWTATIPPGAFRGKEPAVVVRGDESRVVERNGDFVKGGTVVSFVVDGIDHRMLAAKAERVVKHSGVSKVFVRPPYSAPLAGDTGWGVLKGDTPFTVQGGTEVRDEELGVVVSASAAQYGSAADSVEVNCLGVRFQPWFPVEWFPEGLPAGKIQVDVLPGSSLKFVLPARSEFVYDENAKKLCSVMERTLYLDYEARYRRGEKHDLTMRYVRRAAEFGIDVGFPEVSLREALSVPAGPPYGGGEPFKAVLPNKLTDGDVIGTMRSLASAIKTAPMREAAETWKPLELFYASTHYDGIPVYNTMPRVAEISCEIDGETMSFADAVDKFTKDSSELFRRVKRIFVMFTMEDGKRFDYKVPVLALGEAVVATSHDLGGEFVLMLVDESVDADCLHLVADVAAEAWFSYGDDGGIPPDEQREEFETDMAQCFLEDMFSLEDALKFRLETWLGTMPDDFIGSAAFTVAYSGKPGTRAEIAEFKTLGKKNEHRTG